MGDSRDTDTSTEQICRDRQRNPEVSKRDCLLRSKPFASERLRDVRVYRVREPLDGLSGLHVRTAPLEALTPNEVPLQVAEQPSSRPDSTAASFGERCNLLNDDPTLRQRRCQVRI